jgi:cell division protein FtsZ
MGIGNAAGDGRAVNAARGAITSPLLEASIEGARGILLQIAGGSDLGLFEVNEAAEIIHGVAHPDANIIFGSVVDDAMGDEVRVTVIAAGFERWDDGAPRRDEATRGLGLEHGADDGLAVNELGGGDEELRLRDDDFDVPSFLK